MAISSTPGSWDWEPGPPRAAQSGEPRARHLSLFPETWGPCLLLAARVHVTRPSVALCPSISCICVSVQCLCVRVLVHVTRGDAVACMQAESRPGA